MRVAVLGAGAWGTALAVLLASKGVPTRLWARRKAQAEALKAMRENRDYLPGVALPAYLYPTHDPEEALEGAELAVLAVPSKALRETVAGLPRLPGTSPPPRASFTGRRGSGRPRRWWRP